MFHSGNCSDASSVAAGTISVAATKSSLAVFKPLASERSFSSCTATHAMARSARLAGYDPKNPDPYDEAES